jgi:S-formylglutathione hydrolase FrmB
MADNDTDPQLPTVPAVLITPAKSTPDQPVDFANKLEDLMNHAYQQSQDGEHKHLWAAWCNELGDLWRKVKAHA